MGTFSADSVRALFLVLFCCVSSSSDRLSNLEPKSSMAGCGIVLYFANAPKTFHRGAGGLSLSRLSTDDESEIVLPTNESRFFVEYIWLRIRKRVEW